jgi:hypothetical protein
MQGFLGIVDLFNGHDNRSDERLDDYVCVGGIRENKEGEDGHRQGRL